MPLLNLLRKNTVIISFSNEYIDSLMTASKKYKPHLAPSEYYFTEILLRKMQGYKIQYPLNYEIMSTCVNYKIGPFQIGRLSLSNNGISGKIQVLYSDSNVRWHDFSNVDEAIGYIDDWMRYFKKI